MGKIELSVAELIESYESRKDRQKPYDAWHRLQIRGSNYRPVREPSGRTGHKHVSKQGKNAEAEKMQREMLAAQERDLGADHPDTLETAGNLADSLL